MLIVRALAQEAPLIVMDEPTASLDFGNQAQVLAQISILAREAAAQGCGVIMSAHNPDQAFALDAAVLLMKDGCCYAQGPANDVLTAQTLSAVYGIAISVETTTSGRKVCLPSLAPPAASAITPGAEKMA